MVEARQHQNGGERGSWHASCWVHKDLTFTSHDKANSGFVDSSEGVGRKMLGATGFEREYWMGTEIGRVRGYGFRGTVAAGD